MNKIRRFVKNYQTEITVGIIAFSVALVVVSKKKPEVRIVSPSIEEGILIPYESLHDMAETGKAMVMTVRENVDDILDTKYLVQFVGYTQRTS